MCPFLTDSVDSAYGVASSLRDLNHGSLRSCGGAGVAAGPPGQLVAMGWTDVPWAEICAKALRNKDGYTLVLAHKSLEV